MVSFQYVGWRVSDYNCERTSVDFLGAQVGCDMGDLPAVGKGKDIRGVQLESRTREHSNKMWSSAEEGPFGCVYFDLFF